MSSYAAQLENGIPITRWQGSEADTALLKLKKYLLLHYKDAEDVRVPIKEHYLTRLT